jgi:hypothetical protein
VKIKSNDSKLHSFDGEKNGADRKLCITINDSGV